MPSDNNGYRTVPAVRQLFEKTRYRSTKLTSRMNEAFVARVLAVLKAWNRHDPTRLNVNGSGISLGHHIGAPLVRRACGLSPPFLMN